MPVPHLSESVHFLSVIGHFFVYYNIISLIISQLNFWYDIWTIW